MKKILLILLLIIAIPLIVSGGCIMLWVDKDKTTSISDYSKYFGQYGEYHNYIFPIQLK